MTRFGRSAARRFPPRAGNHSVHNKANAVFLTKREYELLSFLLQNSHRAYTAEQLLALAWKKQELSPEEVRTYIGPVRARLKELALDYGW